MTEHFILKQTMAELQNDIQQLIDIISSSQPSFVGFNIQRITKADEKKCMLSGIDELSVSPLKEWNQLHTVLKSWSSFYSNISMSTQYVDRLPGIVVINDSSEEILGLIRKINKLKDDIANIVRKNRNPYQRHEFIHHVFPGIMTEQVYRHIHLISVPVTNAWFNWTSRPVPKSMTIEQCITFLKAQSDKPKYLYIEEEWKAMINSTIESIRVSNFSSIQRYKAFKVFPTIELQYIDEDGIKKRIKKNATTPFILCMQPTTALPKYTNLNNYSATEHSRSKTPKLSKNKVMINKVLGLVGVNKF